MGLNFYPLFKPRYLGILWVVTIMMPFYWLWFPHLSVLVPGPFASSVPVWFQSTVVPISINVCLPERKQNLFPRGSLSLSGLKHTAVSVRETWFTIQLLWPQLDESETTFQPTTGKLGWPKGHGCLQDRAEMHRTNKWIATEERRGEDGGRGPSPTILEPSCSRRIAFISLTATCDRCEWMHLHSPGKSPYPSPEVQPPAAPVVSQPVTESVIEQGECQEALLGRNHVWPNWWLQSNQPGSSDLKPHRPILVNWIWLYLLF